MHVLRPGPGIALTVMIATLFTSAAPLVAQVGADVLAQQSLRPYWYVFIAYALGWLLLLGWVLSIGARLRRLEEDVGREARDA